MLPNSVSLNVKWQFCLFSTSELNDDKWYLYLCISLGFCFGVALIFGKLWTTKHVSVILLWTMMLAAVMLLLWSFEKKTWIFTGCCCCSLSENLDWIFVTSLTAVVLKISLLCMFRPADHFYPYVQTCRSLLFVPYPKVLAWFSSDFLSLLFLLFVLASSPLVCSWL